MGILIVLNFLANKFFLRLDFTEGGQYTLSDATKNILKSLDEPVTVTAYFSENLPPDVAKVKSDFKDLLTEYNSVSGGKIAYQFINPNEDQQKEMEAQQSGIRPVVINVREKRSDETAEGLSWSRSSVWRKKGSHSACSAGVGYGI